ncbi:MAG: metallophosphoesterase [Nitriliruptoraceae bacterium]
MGFATQLVAGIAGIGAACFAYGTVVERRWYRVRHLTLPGVLRIPGTLRVLHLSDIHLVPRQAHRTAFIRSLTDFEYDLVAVTGDSLGDVGAEQPIVEALGSLTSSKVPGVMVLGSNDLFGPVIKSPLSYFTKPGRRTHGARLDTQRLIDGLAGHGYVTLRNGTAVLATRTGTVAVGGIDDPHLATTVIPPAPQVTPAGGNHALHLGLVHAPYTDALTTLVTAGHDVLLAGHTHGGQVRFPPVGALVGNCDLPLKQVRGVSQFGGRWLHVSVGLGHSKYAPFRFACRPEATIITVTGNH